MGVVTTAVGLGGSWDLRSTGFEGRNKETMSREGSYFKRERLVTRGGWLAARGCYTSSKRQANLAVDNRYRRLVESRHWQTKKERRLRRLFENISLVRRVAETNAG